MFQDYVTAVGFSKKFSLVVAGTIVSSTLRGSFMFSTNIGNALDKILVTKIAEKLNETPKFSFTFNDTLFINDKEWLSNERFTYKYPSLVYWLSLNSEFTVQLQRKFAGSVFTERKLPFWLFAVRKSDQRCC